MSQHIKKKHQKGDVLLYRHPVFKWLWFGKKDDEIICYTSRIIPAYSSRPTITDVPQIEMKGLLEATGIHVIVSSHKGIKYRIPFKAGYEEAKVFKSDRVLNPKNKIARSKKKEQLQVQYTDFLTSIISFNIDEPPDPLRDDGYELFDIDKFPLPRYYNSQQIEIDFSKIHQMESGVWTIKGKNGFIGGFDDPIDAYQSYLQLIKEG